MSSILIMVQVWCKHELWDVWYVLPNLGTNLILISTVLTTVTHYYIHIYCNCLYVRLMFVLQNVKIVMFVLRCVRVCMGQTLVPGCQSRWRTIFLFIFITALGLLMRVLMTGQYTLHDVHTSSVISTTIDCFDTADMCAVHPYHSNSL